VGVVLIIAGIFVAWLMSRNITGPLNELTAAAQAIAAGDYHSLALRADGTVVAWGYNLHGEATVPPKEFDQIPEVRDYLAGNSKAIAFVPLNQAGPPLKVISVDGFSPSSTEYPLR